MRAICVVVAVTGGLLTLAARADTGGFRLFDAKGDRVELSSGVSASVGVDEVLKANPGEFEAGNALVPKTVNGAETIIRKSLPKNTTDAERENLAKKKRDELQFLIDQLAGKPLTVSFTVMDIINRRAPQEPPPLPKNATTDDQEMHRRAVVRYRADKAIFDRGPMVAIGKVNWVAPLLSTSKYRAEVAKATDDAKAQVASIDARIRDGFNNKTLTPERRRQLVEEKEAIQDRLRQRLDQLREAEEAKRPVQMVYVMGTEQTFKNWKRAQSRPVKGVVQSAALFPYNVAISVNETKAKLAARGDVNPWVEEMGESYIGMEMVMWAVE